MFEENTVLLAPGDTVICHTDGAVTATDIADEQFGRDRLERLFGENIPYSAEEAVALVFAAIKDFAKGASQTGDITCLSLYRT